MQTHAEIPFRRRRRRRRRRSATEWDNEFPRLF